MDNPFSFPLDIKKPYNFRKLIPSLNLRIAVLAPHPDDFDIISISLKQLFLNNRSIRLCVLSSGSSGVDDPNNLLSDREKASVRENEQSLSCRFFGLQKDHVIFLRLDEDKYGHILYSQPNAKLIKEFWDNYRPNCFFLPHGNDTNIDHQRTFQFFLDLSKNDNRGIIAFLNREPKTISMKTDTITIFNEQEADWKRKILSFHKTQNLRNLRIRNRSFADIILDFNRERAKKLGFDTGYVEEFEIVIPNNNYKQSSTA